MFPNIKIHRSDAIPGSLALYLASLHFFAVLLAISGARLEQEKHIVKKLFFRMNNLPVSVSSFLGDYEDADHFEVLQIISKDLSDPVRSHKDLDKDAAPYFKKAVKFYDSLAKQLVSQGHVLDLFASALDQVFLVLSLKPYKHIYIPCLVKFKVGLLTYSDIPTGRECFLGQLIRYKVCFFPWTFQSFPNEIHICLH
jgi:hypothetical protein